MIARTRWARALLLSATVFGALATHSRAFAAVTIGVRPAPLTPYTSGGCYTPRYPCYEVYGTADPGARVIITVTDDVNPGFSVTASVFAAAVTDPGSGINAGDWSASPDVTDLGLHGLVPSTLTYSAVVTDGAGNTTGSATTTVTKLAASEGDTVGPKTTPAAKGGSGSTNNPSCGALSGCLSSRKDCVVGYIGPLASYTGQVAARVIQQVIASPTTPPKVPGPPGTAQCDGRFYIRGYVEDDWADAGGIASEVADVRIWITNDSTEEIVAESHSFTRRGPQAFFTAGFYIANFEVFQQHTWHVQAVDAAGNFGNTGTGSFTPTPWWAL
jgi:hypothetical protein